MSQIEITPALLSEWKQKAEAAGGGEWKVYEASDGSIFVIVDDSEPHLAEVWWPRDAAHIAAASPAVMLALVDEIKRLNERYDEQKLLSKMMITHAAKQKKEIERLNRQLFIKEEALAAIAEIEKAQAERQQSKGDKE
jgi:proline racemase